MRTRLCTPTCDMGLRVPACHRRRHKRPHSSMSNHLVCILSQGHACINTATASSRASSASNESVCLDSSVVVLNPEADRTCAAGLPAVHNAVHSGAAGCIVKPRGCAAADSATTALLAMFLAKRRCCSACLAPARLAVSLAERHAIDVYRAGCRQGSRPVRPGRYRHA